jgi:hypothetical protein
VASELGPGTIESDIFAFGNLLWELMEQRRRLLDYDSLELWDNYEVSGQDLSLPLPFAEEQLLTLKFEHDCIETY